MGPGWNNSASPTVSAGQGRASKVDSVPTFRIIRLFEALEVGASKELEGLQNLVWVRHALPTGNCGSFHLTALFRLNAANTLWSKLTDHTSASLSQEVKSTRRSGLRTGDPGVYENLRRCQVHIQAAFGQCGVPLLNPPDLTGAISSPADKRMVRAHRLC